jgi:hypothetical protein
MHRSILAAATAAAKPTKALARLAGYSYSPHVRAAVADLVRRGLLLRTPDGLRRHS